MKKYKVIGIMSGTSLDGLDLAYCEFALEKGKWLYKIVNAETIRYDRDWKTFLSIAPKVHTANAKVFDNQFGVFIGQKINLFIRKNKIKTDFISSHGHTVLHQPQHSVTLQIGNGACIAAETKLPVVCDFRSLDVALGGQGAPLVPIGDKLLFGEYDACLNLGGFANISFEKNKKRIAFDICPVNVALNHFSKKLGKEFDENGNFAAHGKINQKLLKKLNELSFYKKKSAKSLSKEWLDENFLTLVKKTKDRNENILRTLCEHISIQISSAANTNIRKPKSNILITGGGVYNSFLTQLIKEKTKAKIIVPNKNTIEFKEALIFAFLGVLRMRGEINTLCTVTGAEKDSSGGAIYLP